MAKFKLKPVSDFKLPIKFVMPNGDEAEIVFTVKHEKASAVNSLFQQETPPSDLEFIKQFATGWDLDEEFNDENLNEAIEFFPAMVVSFSHAYIGALAGNRAKN